MASFGNPVQFPAHHLKEVKLTIEHLRAAFIADDQAPRPEDEREEARYREIVQLVGTVFPLSEQLDEARVAIDELGLKGQPRDALSPDVARELNRLDYLRKGIGSEVRSAREQLVQLSLDDNAVALNKLVENWPWIDSNSSSSSTPSRWTPAKLANQLAPVLRDELARRIAPLAEAFIGLLRTIQRCSRIIPNLGSQEQGFVVAFDSNLAKLHANVDSKIVENIVRDIKTGRRACNILVELRREPEWTKHGQEKLKELRGHVRELGRLWSENKGFQDFAKIAPQRLAEAKQQAFELLEGDFLSLAQTAKQVQGFILKVTGQDQNPQGIGHDLFVGLIIRATIFSSFSRTASQAIDGLPAATEMFLQRHPEFFPIERPTRLDFDSLSSPYWLEGLEGLGDS